MSNSEQLRRPQLVVLTEDMAARMLSLSPRTLQRMRMQGDGPRFCRLGLRRIGYTEADLTDWVSQRLVQSTAAKFSAMAR